MPIARAIDSSATTSGCTSSTIDFNLPHGEWIRLYRANGFVVEDLIEPRPAQDARSSYRDEIEREWSRRWPTESIWRLPRN